ncbi:uracil-DNA glycosylase [Dongia sp.]|uniref:uracil-DNA glycosylase n=1 Tax=Dongia sp. TaxID=1977262 RepID=UPI0035B29939
MPAIAPSAVAQPGHDCQLCPRLAEFRAENRQKLPDYFNGPVPAFGDDKPRFLIIGLAPGLHGANRTGRPFTGDWAGDLLFGTLLELKLATGTYDERPDDGLTLRGCRIVNGVRCVPPQNKPTPAEIKTCNTFLKAEIAASPARCYLALGSIAHDAALMALGERRSAFKFGHNRRHDLSDGRILIDSYHCSRYNTNTGVLTPQMFKEAMAQVKEAAGL